MNTLNNHRTHRAIAEAIILFVASPIEFAMNLSTMNSVWRERRELEQLTDAHIKDIGLSPDVVRQESKRSFFDIPEDRRWRLSARLGYVQCQEPGQLCQSKYQKSF